MLVKNQVCRTLDLSIYTNSLHVIEKMYQGASQKEIKNRNTENEYFQVWDNR